MCCVHVFVCLSIKVLVQAPSTTTLLEQLVPDTPYNVEVVAIYADGEGPSISNEGTTRKTHPQYKRLESYFGIYSCRRLPAD